jgi:Putative NADH-flavin reductase
MKVVVFGSTGTVGKHVVNQALDKGHQVTAFARNIEKIEVSDSLLTKVAGDVHDADAVEKAVVGQDAVIVVLGAGRNGGIRAEGTQQIIRAMEKLGVKRLICQSTMGVGDSRESLTFFWKYIMFGFLLKPAYLDHIEQEKYVKASHLDWTIVRPGAFTDGALTQNYKHGFPASDKAIQLKISRADVADFLLKQLDNFKYLHQSPSLSY